MAAVLLSESKIVLTESAPKNFEVPARDSFIVPASVAHIFDTSSHKLYLSKTMKILMVVMICSTMFEVSDFIFKGSYVGFILINRSNFDPLVYIHPGSLMLEAALYFAMALSSFTLLLGVFLGTKSFIKQSLFANGIYIILLSTTISTEYSFLSNALTISIGWVLLSLALKIFYFWCLSQNLKNIEPTDAICALDMFYIADLQKSWKCFLRNFTVLLTLVEIFVCLCIGFLFLVKEETTLIRRRQWIFFIIPAVVLTFFGIYEICKRTVQSSECYLIVLGCLFFSTAFLKGQLIEDFSIESLIITSWSGIMGAVVFTVHCVQYLLLRADDAKKKAKINGNVEENRKSTGKNYLYSNLNLPEQMFATMNEKNIVKTFLK